MSMDGFIGARAFDEYLGEMMTLIRKQDPSLLLDDWHVALVKLLVAGCSERAGSDELYSFPSARGVVSCLV